MNNQAREWQDRALEAEAEVEEGIDLVRDLLKDHYLEMREAQANAFQVICQVALQASTADDATREHPSILGRTISLQLDTIRDQAEQITMLEEQHADALNDSAEVIRKCNEQLAALAAAAKLRDRQVESLARLWSAAFDHRGSPLGPVLTRQLYRVMADHGVDVSCMPESREHSADSSHKIMKEHTQLAQRARAVLASWRATDDGAVPEQLSVEIAKLAIIVEP